MMTYKSENQVKMTLGINNWRNLLNDKLIRFTEMMPEMDRLMLMDLIGKLPQFWLLSKSTLELVESRMTDDLTPDDEALLFNLHKILNHELSCESDKPVDPKQLIDFLVGNLGSALELNSKDREFFSSLQRNSQHASRLKALVILSYIGGKMN